MAGHPVDRVLAVRENTNTGWEATIGGRTLKPLVVEDGEGWILPAGTSGEVVLRFAPDTTYRAGLLLGGILLAVVVLLAVLPARQPTGRTSSTAVPRGRRRVTRSLPLLAVGAAALVLSSGLIGGLLVAAGFMLAVPGPRRLPWTADPRRARTIRRAVETWLPGALVLLAGWAYLESTRGTPTPWLQLAIVVALGALWLSTAARRRPVRRATPNPRGPSRCGVNRSPGGRAEATEPNKTDQRASRAAPPSPDHVSARRPGRPEETAEPEPTGGRANGLGAAGVASPGRVLVNGLAYLVPVLAARRLDPADLSELATALGLVAIVGVPGLGLQLAVAVHHARHGTSDTRRLTAVTAAVCAGASSRRRHCWSPLLTSQVEVPALLAVTTAAIVLSSAPSGSCRAASASCDSPPGWPCSPWAATAA